ncbi:type II toxin-antitoxin system VapC family toxin [Methylobacterium sp. J-070]|uniref:type II toxin-antitoxin system VapC family toxin n=1 Tax=Methylobacterium sp. J-070 TaxID=2836650 RepID=UPI001FBA6EDF|nr:type II toxin-antitoxin system VapC family toxin [Methylobacterium sp. J-070]MCJ2050146.1 type II toxin-antitoxin system VapC family toxin [Methylobacterium sp. J-070]
MDLRGALRRRKPDKRSIRLVPRPQHEAADDWTAFDEAAPLALVLDTGVYIHSAAGRLPEDLQGRIERALLFHCAVALAELAVGVAASDPVGPNWPALRDHYAELFGQIPDTRLLTPDAQTYADAGILAGTLARLQGYQSHQRTACLADALIFLTAARAGLPVLTANRDDFDLLQQLAPEGRFLAYERD